MLVLKDGEIVPYFDDPYLELVRLLREGAGLEHTLLAAYLFSLISLKPAYVKVRGDLSDVSYLERNPGGRGNTWVAYQPETFLDIALEEMQHLDLVNRYLCDLGGAPTVMPHLFPYSSDVYPFTVEPSSLTRYTAATYLWAEADACALSLDAACAGTSDPALAKEVRKVLATEGPPGSKPIDQQPVSHVGSLYHRIIDLTRQVRADPPKALPPSLPWEKHLQAMQWLTDEGEIAHFGFFRTVFDGTAFGKDASVWSDPTSAGYPSIALRWGSTYPGPRYLTDQDERDLARLANLHYWVLVGMLDQRYRGVDRQLQYLATDVMRFGLWELGLWMASKLELGLPFDPLGPQYDLVANGSSLVQLARLADEGAILAQQLAARSLLPPGFDVGLLARVSAVLCPPPPAGGS